MRSEHLDLRDLVSGPPVEPVEAVVNDAEQGAGQRAEQERPQGAFDQGRERFGVRGREQADIGMGRAGEGDKLPDLAQDENTCGGHSDRGGRPLEAERMGCGIAGRIGLGDGHSKLPFWISAAPNYAYNRTRLRRSELPITATELKAMAAPAMIGLNSSPKVG